VTPEVCWSLSIDVSRRLLGLLERGLAELGHTSFEERAAAGGVARILIYDANPAALAAVQRALSGPESGALRGALRFELREVPPDWALAWTAHLEPVALTPAITLYPHRPEGAAKPGALYLEPAFAFGFGEHESTRLLARWLEASCRLAPGLSVLDVGCGTGVLALVARCSGAGRVVAVDVSEPAIAAARANAALNQLDAVSFIWGSLADVEGEFDRVVANIEAGVLIELAPAIARTLNGTGEVALAGLVREQCQEVIERYGSFGITLGLCEDVAGWCSLAGRRGPPR
jgi:ribosomal protein L11 methyltransferase